MAVFIRKPLLAAVRSAVWDASHGRCHYCEKPLHPFNDFQVDHVVAVSQGGTNDPDNLVASCRACNSQKWAHDEDDFRNRLARKAHLARKAAEKPVIRIGQKRGEQQWVSTGKASEMLNIPVFTVRRWLRSGRIPGTLLSRRAGYRIRRDDIDRVLAEGLPAEELGEVKLAA